MLSHKSDKIKCEIGPSFQKPRKSESTIILNIQKNKQYSRGPHPNKLHKNCIRFPTPSPGKTTHKPESPTNPYDEQTSRPSRFTTWSPPVAIIFSTKAFQVTFSAQKSRPNANMRRMKIPSTLVHKPIAVFRFEVLRRVRK